MKITFLKIVGWVKQGLSFVKDIFELGKWVIMIILALSTWSGIKSCKDQKQEKESYITIAKNESKQIATLSGRHAVEKRQWQLNNDALKQNISQEQAKNSHSLKEIKELKEVIKDMKIREKNVQNYIKTELISRDSMNTTIVFENEPCAFKLEPIETEFLSLKFNQDIDYSVLGITYLSRNTIYTLFDRKAEPKKRAVLKKNIGKDHKLLPEAGWLWGWDYYATTMVKDTNSIVTNNIVISFQK